MVGGFLAWRWPRTLVLHMLVVGWGIAGVVVELPCPLTEVERWARAGAGVAELPPEGFIEHYLTGVLYPASAQGVVQVLVFGIVAVSWGLLAAGRLRRPA